ncbi:hypothetical protein EYF80_033313 [Liparis tanakae]|uniref:Uncharacterized protein n=1 Tax=Liparis tanakae TaxID=230148 RepID=A0A4Z2GUL9_9TELE|nr:hypothetical protein EYF80_033313 [Liparis tanakae]
MEERFSKEEDDHDDTLNLSTKSTQLKTEGWRGVPSASLPWPRQTSTPRRSRSVSIMLGLPDAAVSGGQQQLSLLTRDSTRIVDARQTAVIPGGRLTD